MSETDLQDDLHGPGVRIHPPIIYAMSILIGIGLHNEYPLAMPLEIHGRLYGSILFSLACVIAGLSLREFLRANTDVRADKPVSALITTGPYRYSRNPLYIVLTLTQITVAIWFNNAWILLMTILSVVVITQYAIKREERYLEKLFGQDYIEYRQHVRRWL